MSWGIFTLLLISYWLTSPHTVSYWDCPEYVAAAWRLEIGHPPGNPVWMLVERIITMLAPSGKYAALAVNLSSGLFTAFAGFFLSRSIFAMALFTFGPGASHKKKSLIYAAGGALCGALAFGWCDSTWYSAVEAEVYAMSIFMTSLCLWLMLKWATITDPAAARRYLILIAYLFGLSLGIHQLNLLLIPALAVIWGIKRGIRSRLRQVVLVILSFAAVAMVLVAMMPSTIALAAAFELIAVNELGLPFLWGVGIYVATLALSLLLAVMVTSRSTNWGTISMSLIPALFLSGIFIVAGNFAIGAALSALAAILLVRPNHFNAGRLNLCVWMLAMMLTGYSAYALIPIRGSIPSPANAAMPGEPFSFASYQAREQYGGAPLLYGHTPYSKPLFIEKLDSTGKAVYSSFYIKRDHPVTVPYENGALIRDPYKLLTPDDSIFNSKALSSGRDAYIIESYRPKTMLTPELDMWLPRITSRDASDLPSFADWTGMTPETMTEVEISESIDSTGRLVTRLDAAGKRTASKALRPTYIQHLRMLLGYQTGYMYFRYLLWNFSGRQNDIASTGEVEHGNFITGFPIIDNAMLGAEDSLPPHAGSRNKGRNRYFMIPLLLGIAGIVWLLMPRPRRRETCAVIAMLFIMTGLAIVVYLNQGPGEPRERDYSFLGSYMAYSIWIGFGAIAVARLGERFTRTPVFFIFPLLAVAWMLKENYDDHDRSGRRAASNLTANILNSLDRNAIIFVNGDNYTFPLWYMQEVEGLRRDVRVVNYAYLALPRYAANLMKEWESSAPVPSVLKRGDFICNALLFAKVPDKADTVDATEALLALADSPDGTFPSRYARVTLPDGTKSVIDLRKLSSTGKTSIAEFRKLFIFNIIAANANNNGSRPIYWLNSMPSKSAAGFDTMLKPELFARRLVGATCSDSITDERESLAALPLILPPNDSGREVYMDGAPSGQVAFQRASLTQAALRMLRGGLKAEAVKTALLTDSLFNADPRTFKAVTTGDTIFSTGKEFGKLLLELADSTGDEKLRRRGEQILEAEKERTEAWKRYRKALPPRLRSKMATIK